MSSNKILLFVFLLVMAGLIAGITLMSTRSKTSQQTQLPVANQQQVGQNSLSPANTAQTSPALIKSGTSDQQLQQDTQSIDSSLSTLNNDLNNVDSGLNDQQTNLQ